MAEKVELGPGTPAKVRNPWAVAGLFLITLLMYGLYWIYSVNRELRDFGLERSDERLAGFSPAWNLVWFFLTAWLIMPAIMIGRVRHAQRVAGVEQTNLPLLVALFVVGWFLVIPIPALFGVLQDGLNRVWLQAKADRAAP